jgi:hypothetical protein
MDDKLKNIISNSLSVENVDINNIDNQNCTKILYLIIGLILKSSLDDIESYSYLKTKISKTKLSQMRNYYYGIIIENFIYHYKLIQYQKNTLDYIKQEESFYEEIYGKKLNLLYDQFISQAQITNRHKLNIHEYKKFCYWLFKYRIKNSDKAKMASETNLALNNAQKNLDRRILILFE